MVIKKFKKQFKYNQKKTKIHVFNQNIIHDILQDLVNSFYQIHYK